MNDVNIIKSFIMSVKVVYVHILTHMYFAASLLSDYVNAAVIVWYI